MLALVDIGVSNIGSVVEAFRRIGSDVTLTRDAAAISSARAVILPGVGAFQDGMRSLREKALVEPITTTARAGTPLLGFCLGMQLMAEGSDEHGSHAGLGLLPGRVRRLAPSRHNERIPNIGWCDVTARPGATLFHGIAPGTSFYFVHSYHLDAAENAHVAATLAYGSSATTAACEHGNIFGLQFHPEKSQDAGLAVLANFLAHVQRRGGAAA